MSFLFPSGFASVNLELIEVVANAYEDEDSSAMEEFMASSPPAWNADIAVS